MIYSLFVWLVACMLDMMLLMHLSFVSMFSFYVYPFFFYFCVYSFYFNGILETIILYINNIFIILFLYIDIEVSYVKYKDVIFVCM